MIVVPGYQCNQVVAPFGVADEKKRSADKKQENNHHAFPKKVHSGPNQSYSVLPFLHTQTSDPAGSPMKTARRNNRQAVVQIGESAGLKHSVEGVLQPASC